ncbi:hypothetical protein Q1695_005093 [Nippostrongylus brasiliensis]|nr:hypothetical protein Q1695_005093 [Nippostrongylus brasiliensis]
MGPGSAVLCTSAVRPSTMGDGRSATSAMLKPIHGTNTADAYPGDNASASNNCFTMDILNKMFFNRGLEMFV